MNLQDRKINIEFYVTFRISLLSNMSNKITSFYHLKIDFELSRLQILKNQ